MWVSAERPSKLVLDLPCRVPTLQLAIFENICKPYLDSGPWGTGYLFFEVTGPGFNSCNLCSLHKLGHDCVHVHRTCKGS